VTESSPTDPRSQSLSRRNTAALVVTAGALACVIPVEHVIETMRPLAVDAVAGMPSFVRGISIIRGKPVPVVDLGALLGSDGTAEGMSPRFVLVRAGERSVALAVQSVIGVRDVEPSHIGDLPPLLSGVAAEVIESIGTSDAHLLVVLRTAWVVPAAEATIAAWSERAS
jgi:purine-binding chemotaxis protein CheW